MQKELYGTGNDEYEDEDGGIVHGQGNDEKRQDEYYRRKMYELETRLGNMILQTIVNGRKDVDSIEKDKKKLHELENKKTNLDWEINSKKYSNEYAVNKAHDEKSKKNLPQTIVAELRSDLEWEKVILKRKKENQKGNDCKECYQAEGIYFTRYFRIDWNQTKLPVAQIHLWTGGEENE